MAYDYPRRLGVRCLLVASLLMVTASYLDTATYAGTPTIDTHDYAYLLHGLDFDLPAMAIESNADIPVAPRHTAIVMQHVERNAAHARSVARDHVTMLRQVQARC